MLSILHNAYGAEAARWSRTIHLGGGPIHEVMVGDPVNEFKKRTQELILKDKQEKVLQSADGVPAAFSSTHFW